MRVIEIGKTYIFKYPEEFTTLPHYSAQRGKPVLVIRELIDGTEYDMENDDRMYLVQFENGNHGNAFASELEDA